MTKKFNVTFDELSESAQLERVSNNPSQEIIELGTKSVYDIVRYTALYKADPSLNRLMQELDSKSNNSTSDDLDYVLKTYFNSCKMLQKIFERTTSSKLMHCILGMKNFQFNDACLLKAAKSSDEGLRSVAASSPIADQALLENMLMVENKSKVVYIILHRRDYRLTSAVEKRLSSHPHWEIRQFLAECSKTSTSALVDMFMVEKYTNIFRAIWNNPNFALDSPYMEICNILYQEDGGKYSNYDWMCSAQKIINLLIYEQKKENKKK